MCWNNQAERPGISSSNGDSMISTAWRKAHAERNFFCYFTVFQNCVQCGRGKRHPLMPGQYAFQHVCQSLLKYLFYHLPEVISNLFYIYFTLFCDIMLSIQHNWAYKTDVKFKTTDAQRYFLIRSIATVYGWQVEIWCLFPSNLLLSIQQELS